MRRVDAGADYGIWAGARPVARRTRAAPRPGRPGSPLGRAAAQNAVGGQALDERLGQRLATLPTAGDRETDGPAPDPRPARHVFEPRRVGRMARDGVAAVGPDAHGLIDLRQRQDRLGLVTPPTLDRSRVLRPPPRPPPT